MSNRISEAWRWRKKYEINEILQASHTWILTTISVSDDEKNYFSFDNYLILGEYFHEIEREGVSISNSIATYNKSHNAQS